MKKLLLLTALFISLATYSQVSIGGGIGVADKANFAGNISVNYNATHWIGLDGGLSYVHQRAKYFSLQVYSPILQNNIDWKISPMIGYAYRIEDSTIEMKSKKGNGWDMIAGLEVARNVNNRGVVYLRASYSPGNTWVVIGLRGFLGKRDDCY
jgi:predicted porin